MIFTMPLVLSAFLLSSTAMVATPVLAQAYSFSNVTVEGNTRVDARTITNRAGIGRGQAVSAAGLNDAYQNLLNTGLFESVTLVPRGGTLVIQVKEFPTVKVVNFEGNSRLKAEALTAMVETRERRVYSAATAEADAAKIAEAYSKMGRMAARVEPRIIPRAGNQVDVVFEIAEGKPTEVERISFVGNRAFSDRRLRQVLSTKQAGLLRQLISSDTYVSERVDMDRQLLRDFYLSRGYIDFQVLDATAEMAREQDGFFVTFSVSEGLQYSFGQTRVVSEIPNINPAEYQGLLRIGQGATYSPSDVDGAIQRMEAFATRKGINFLRVEPRLKRNDRNRTVDVDFALVRGERVFVERIDIEGNTTTLDQVIRRQFRTVEGDPMNPRQVREAAERIRALGYFENASVEATQGSTPESVIVKTTVEEKPTGSLSFGASYGKVDGMGFMIGLSEANFLGRGQYVAVDLNLGTSNATSSIRFAEPALLGRDLRFNFALQYAETEANYERWDSRKFELRTGLEFPLTETMRLETRYTFRNSKMFGLSDGTKLDSAGDVIAAASQVLQDEQALGALDASGLGYQFSWDSRRSGIPDKTAYVARISQDYYGLGGDQKYVATEAFLGAQRAIFSGDVNLRAELEGGAVVSKSGQVSRALERYYLNNKVRGFEPFSVGPRDLGADRKDALGGNYYFAARLEADFPIGLPEEYGIRGAGFVDAGSVWGLDNTLGGAIDDSMQLRSSVGVSLLWDTPIGPLRFNFTKPLKQTEYDKPQNFDLTLSTKF